MIDPSIVGKTLAEVQFPIERSKLAELARSFGDLDPVWHDARSAAAAGFEAVPTPPTVTCLLDHWRDGGVPALVAALGLDLNRILHGNVAWDYLVPVRSGDALSARQFVSDISQRQGKRGGAMTLVKMVTEFTNQRGQLAVRRTDTLIEREI